VVQGGSDLDWLAEQGDGVGFAGLESGLWPGHGEVGGKCDEGGVSFGLDMYGWFGEGGVVERGQDLAHAQDWLAWYEFG